MICLTWICKGLALFADEKLVIYSNVTYAVQGLVIFVLFVMNGHVLHLINQRYVVQKAVAFSFDLEPFIKKHHFYFEFFFFQMATFFRQAKRNQFK